MGGVILDITWLHQITWLHSAKRLVSELVAGTNWRKYSLVRIVG